MIRLLNISKKSKLSSWVLISTAIFSVLSSYTVLIYETGRVSGQKEKVIELSKIFNFESNFREQEIDLINNVVTLQKIYLAKSSVDISDRKDYYIIRQIVDTPIKTVEIGSVAIDKKQNRQDEYVRNFWQSLKKVLSLELVNFKTIELAFAQQIFEWYGYENNYDFYEKYVSEFVIRRFYDDGAILEYMVNAEGTSIAGTFKWIEKP